MVISNFRTQLKQVLTLIIFMLVHVLSRTTVIVNKKLSYREETTRSVLRVIKYFNKSLKISQGLLK